jgi:hypothetical protein
LVDPESIEDRLDRLAELLEELARIQAAGHEAYVTDAFRLPGVFGAALDAELAERLGDAAGMRNILVHGYLDVDDEAVWGALARLDDLRQFAAFAQQQLSR